MKDDNCIFCKIAAGEIPGATLYEDDDFRVILDIGPASKGHALVLPKNHYRDLLDIPEGDLKKAFYLTKRVAARIKEETNCDGINIVQNNGLAAGQTVFHFHIHIIPRYEGDGAMVGWTPGELDETVRDELVEAFRKNPIK